MHILLAAMAFILLIALLIHGVIYLVVHFWWLLLLAAAGFGVWLYLRHPGVRLKRELRQVAKSGEQQRVDIKESTAQAKADMEQIARNWKSWR